MPDRRCGVDALPVSAYKSLRRLGVQHRFFVVDAVMIDEESIPAAERIEPERNGEEIFGSMVQRNCQSRFPSTQRRFRPLERGELAPLDVHLDEIDFRQSAFGDEAVDSPDREIAAEDRSSRIPRTLRSG